MKKRLFPKGVTICPRPMMKCHRGRTWDQCKVILPDGVKINGYLDTSWGTNFYFRFEKKWYRAPILDFEKEDNSYSLTFDLSKEGKK